MEAREKKRLLQLKRTLGQVKLLINNELGSAPFGRVSFRR
jgi:hypothetical protein